MPIGRKKFYFGRLNIIASYGDKQSYILHGLRPGVSIDDRGNSWSFAEISELSNDLGNFVHGYLVKFSDSFEEVIRPEQGQFDETPIEDRVEAKAQFFLHIKTGLIAYSPVGNQIAQKTFQDKFCQVFEKSHDNLFVDAEIQTIEERHEIFERIMDFQIVEKITFRLHPSNPNRTPLWNDIDDDIKSMGATSYTEEYSVKQGAAKGLNKGRILEDPKIKGKFIMAEDGYGEGKATGIIQEERKTITTGNNPTTVTVLERPEATDVLESLKDKLIKIFDRFRQNEK
jgi:hypothetical protein